MNRDWLLVGLLGLSLSTNLALGLALLKAVGRPDAEVADGAQLQQKVGQKLPALEAQRLDGTLEPLSYGRDTRPTVIYVFSASCTWCERNLDNVRVLSRVAAAGRFRLVGLSMGPGAAEYVRRENLGFPVYEKPTAASVRAYGLGVTPQTLVVSKDGILEKVWQGAYAGRTKQEVEAWLGEALPGLTEPTTARGERKEGGSS